MLGNKRKHSKVKNYYIICGCYLRFNITTKLKLKTRGLYRPLLLHDVCSLESFRFEPTTSLKKHPVRLNLPKIGLLIHHELICG